VRSPSTPSGGADATPDGRSAVGPYPEGARAERPIVVEVGTYRAEAAEPFSPPKHG